jgi:hypothetical protein
MDFAALDGTKSSWLLPKNEKKDSSVAGSKKKVKEKKGLMGFGKSRNATVSVEESKSILFSYGRSDDYDADEDEPISNTKSRLAWDMGNFLDEEPPTVDFKSGFAFVECSKFLLDDESDDPTSTFQKSNFDFLKDIEEDDESEHSAPELKSDESDVVVPDYSLIQCREEFEHSVSRDIHASETLLEIVENSLLKEPSEKKSKKSGKKKTKEDKKTKAKKKKKKKKITKEEVEKDPTTQNEKKSSHLENFHDTNMDRQVDISSIHKNPKNLKEIDMYSQPENMNRRSSVASRATAGGDVSYVGMSSIASGTSSRQSLTHQDYMQHLMALNVAAGLINNGTGTTQLQSNKKDNTSDTNQALPQRKYIDNMGDLMSKNILDGSIHTKHSTGREGDGYMADTDGAPDVPGQGHGHLSPSRSIVKVPPTSTQNADLSETLATHQNVASGDHAPVQEKKRFRGLKKRLTKGVKS